MIVAFPPYVGLGVEVHDVEPPETVHTTEPVGAGKPETPATVAVKVKVFPATGVEGDELIEICEKAAPRFTLIVEDVALL